jgi:pSer/pThr/pTyr-binding forkhead associated (FHA) protein
MIVFAGGEKDGQKVLLDKPRVTFGRNPKNVVSMNDAGMSGFHAEIAREGGAYVLRDLGSTNGTLVDGEPVSETALQHGARIRMGATRFVFVDPTVSDFEKAMAAVDDLGSEWGMLRAEMDMTRVQEARRSQLVTTIVVLLVVVGGGAFVYMNKDKLVGGAAPLVNVAGNKIEDFSFEMDQGKGWTARPGSPTKAPSAGDPKSDGKAKQGTAFLAVARNGAGGACAAAQSGVAYSVSPGTPIEFGAWVRTSGGAMGGVRLSWLDKPDASGREVGRSSSVLTAASEWQEVKGVAVPPDEARAARVELINASTGTAFFDDIFFVPGAGGASGGTQQDGKIKLTATGDAQTTVARDGAKILIDGAVIGGALRADAIDDPSRRGDRSGSQSLSPGAGLTASGNFVDPATGQPVAFNVAVASKDGRYVDVSANLGNPEAAWVATLPNEFVDAGVGVRVEGGDFRRATDPHLYDKVLEVGFGGAHRFKVSRGEKCGPLRMALYRVGDGWEVGFGVSEGKLDIVFDTDSTEITKGIDKLNDDATTAIQQRRFGTAIAKLHELSGFYPAGSKEAQDVEDKLKKLESDGKTRYETLDRRITGAVQFRDVVDLRGAAKDSKQLADEFKDNQIGTDAGKIAGKCADALKSIDLAIDERMAKPLERKADDFAKHQVDGKPMTALARAFYNEIIVRFPDTEAAKRAREKIAGLKD